MVYINHIDQVKDAIKDNQFFYIADKGDYLIANYTINIPDVFPDPFEAGISQQETNRRLIFRECRGITFNKKGDVIRRPFRKFFNYGEKSYENHLFDISQPHLVMTKLDGSMISPFRLDEIHFGTKLGITDVSKPVMQFIHNNTHMKYMTLAQDLIDGNFTPTFEWCSRKQQIVIDYPEDQLVLTGIREMNTGDDIPYDQMKLLAETYNIPIVEVHEEITDILEFMENAKSLRGMEGYVIRFANHIGKVKADEYCDLHSVVSSAQSERQVISLYMEDSIDDALPKLPEHIRVKLEKFSNDLTAFLNAKFKEIYEFVISKEWVKKDLAVAVTQDPEMKKFSGFYFKAFDMVQDNTFDYEQMFKVWVNVGKSSLNRNIRIEENRHLIGGLSWMEFQIDEE